MNNKYSSISRYTNTRDLPPKESSSTTPAPGGRRAYTPTAPRGYKNDLNKLFDTGEVPERFKEIVGTSGSAEGADRQKLIRLARTAETPQDFNVLMEQLVSKYELPDDQDLLIRGLDHPKEEIIRASLDALMEMDGTRPLTKRKLITARMEILEQVCKDPQIHDLIKLLRERL